jgi:2',3'-cyclic-nucleotide 2'-phosphodiesterase (5'-nucleotidase family)
MHQPRTFAARAVAPLLLAVLALAGCSDNPKEKRVALLFTTDEHSHVFGIAPEVDDWPLATGAGTGGLVGGMARRATLIAQQRAAMADTVVLSSGDSTQGTLATVPFATANFDMQLEKALGYDVVSLGNHEFDQSPALLAMAVSAASANGGIGAPQLVLTNIKFSASSAADDSLAALYGPGKPIAPSHVVTTPGGIKVGVVASMGVSAASVAAPFAAPVTFTNGVPTSAATNALAAIAAQLQPVVDSLRNDSKVDVVVLLSHGGVLEAGGTNEDEALAARLTGLDLVLSGHSHAAAQPVRYVNDPVGHKVALLQTSPYGKELGRAELVWLEGDRPRLDTDPARTRYIPVSESVVPTTNAQVVGLINTLVAALEVSASGPSFLEQTLYAVLGTAVTHTATRGDLYFYPLGHTAFAVRGLGTGESNMLNLDTDALLAAANAFGGATQVALQARGSMRADIQPGKTGTLSFADLYRAAPLGIDPTNGTPGYPILRFLMARAELRAALEGTLLKSLEDPDYFVSPSGLKVKYDRTRAMWNPADPTGLGWITYMATVTGGVEDPPFYDTSLSAAGWLSPTGPAVMVPVAATYQLGAFAASLGISPRNPATGAPVAVADLPTLMIRYPCATAPCPSVKDHQALASYVAQACAGNAGQLPVRYDATNAAGAIPRRMVCTGADCPH